MASVVPYLLEFCAQYLILIMQRHIIEPCINVHTIDG
ncbi:Protein of unknown function [Anaplasma phagocytophilum]|uniref:Uncharacterized protein n=1 Tax=Anaplasma phagocytophilum TaxID=948 RepID=A0A098EDZ2_ANAPH|nr:Protein of unknown function [Anaplasma phagocytophilum]